MSLNVWLRTVQSSKQVHAHVARSAGLNQKECVDQPTLCRVTHGPMHNLCPGRKGHSRRYIVMQLSAWPRTPGPEVHFRFVGPKLHATAVAHGLLHEHANHPPMRNLAQTKYTASGLQNSCCWGRQGAWWPLVSPGDAGQQVKCTNCSCDSRVLAGTSGTTPTAVPSHCPHYNHTTRGPAAPADHHSPTTQTVMCH